MTTLPRVQGNCPMGCGQTLQLDATGVIVCSNRACLEPHAVTTILRDTESEHIVEFTVGGFTSRHPLRERVHSWLSDCRFQEELANELAGPPVPPGVYRAERDIHTGEWCFTPVAKESIYG